MNKTIKVPKIKNDPSLLTCESINYFMRNELKNEKEYHSFGLHLLAIDENHHAEYLIKQWHRLKCAEKMGLTAFGIPIKYTDSK